MTQQIETLIREAQDPPKDLTGATGTEWLAKRRGLVRMMRLRLALIHGLAQSAPEVFGGSGEWEVVDEYLQDLGRYDDLMKPILASAAALLSFSPEESKKIGELIKEQEVKSALHGDALSQMSARLARRPRKLFRIDTPPFVNESEMLTPDEQGMVAFAVPRDVMVRHWPMALWIPAD